MVSDHIEGISGEWMGIRQLIKIYRLVKSKGKIREEVAYYISSRSGNAFLYSEGVRLHWQIETLHYVKDVTFCEDSSKIRTANAPSNFSTMRNMAINLMRRKYKSMKQAIRLLANDIPELIDLII